MAIIVESSRPESLLRTIKDAIDDGTIENWSYDDDGDLTYEIEKWKKQAWLRPRVSQNRLILNIIAPKEREISADAYAIYHSRFVYILLLRFDRNFSDVRVTALPTTRDIVK